MPPSPPFAPESSPRRIRSQRLRMWLAPVRWAIIGVLIGTILSVVVAAVMVWKEPYDTWLYQWSQSHWIDRPEPWPVSPPEVTIDAGLSDSSLIPQEWLGPEWPDHSDESAWFLPIRRDPTSPLRLAWMGDSYAPGKFNAGGVVRLWGYANTHDSAGPIVTQHRFNLSTTEFGWPFLAFRYAAAQHNQDTRDSNESEMRWVLRGRWMFGAFGWGPPWRTTIPMPIWPGLILNVLIFGLIGAPVWRGLCTMISSARSAYRRHRSPVYCRHCRYPREGLASPEAPCPECGETQSLSPPTAL